MHLARTADDDVCDYNMHLFRTVDDGDDVYTVLRRLVMVVCASC